jgi:polysaccharide export outer membrane protein
MRSSRYKLLLIALVLTVSILPTFGQSGQVRQQVAEKTEPAAVQDDKKPTPPASKDRKDNKGLSEEQIQGLRRQRPSEEEAADLSYLRNYFEEYRLGPEDVIKVEVFGQSAAAYSESSIIVPPDGKINYKLIGPIVVRGRTVEDVQKEIAEKLTEYIIDPKVTVQLVQSHSMKYIIDGDVGRPGIFEMTRRMTIREAIVFSGGILPTGDETKVQIARAMPTGQTELRTINFKELRKGKGSDEFLAPGDMIFVPGNRFKTIQKWSQVVQTITWLPMMIGVRR